MFALSATSTGSGFIPPGAKDFQFPAIWGDSIYFTKPVLLVALSVVLISTFLFAATRKGAIVPGRLQFAGEGIYSFVRNTLGRDVIGPEFIKYVPLLFSIFCFILVNNVFGVIPLIQFPTMSHIGFPVALTLFVYFVFHTVAIKKHGLIKYLKDMMFMPGIPKVMYIILAPLEFATYLKT